MVKTISKHLKNLINGILSLLVISGAFWMLGASLSAEVSLLVLLVLLIYFEIWDLNKENKK